MPTPTFNPYGQLPGGNPFAGITPNSMSPYFPLPTTTVDPNYQYAHGGGQKLQSDYAQMRARLAAGYNPFEQQAQFRQAHTVGHTPLLGRLGNSFNYDVRKSLGLWGLGMLGGAAAAGAFGGAGAGVGAGTAAGAGGATVPAGYGGAGTLAALAPSEVAGNSAFIGAAGLGGAAGAGAAAATPWYNTFLGQTGINTGANLLGGFLQNRAIQGAQNASNQQIQDRIRQALAALSPEQIMSLAQRFLPQMAANMNQAGQTAVQAVREQAARTGQLEGPRALSFEAGTRAKLAQDVQQQAFLAAINNAGAQAGAITGAPYTPIQPQTGYADAVMNSINQAYLARALSQQPQQYSPYRWPSQGYGYGWSAPGVPNWGA